MPAPLATTADRLAPEGIIRTCTRCSAELPLNPVNFFHRNNGWIDARCQDCRRAVDAANRTRRAEGAGVRAGRKFGIEVEFIGTSYSAVVREMQARGLTASYEGYTHRIRQGAWKVVTDGSVSNVYELVSPPLRGAAGRREVKLACEALAAAGARISRSCGLHVHHDIHDLDATHVGRLARLWANNQRAINGLVAPSRRNSRWAAPLRTDEVERLEALDTSRYSGNLQLAVRSLYIDRYRSLNFDCFPRYGTVEVRQHQGTIAADKILAWIEFGQAMIRFAKSADALTTEPTADALVERLGRYGMEASTVTFLKRRAAFFARRTRTAVAA